VHIAAIVCATPLGVATACSDSNVPYFNAPTTIPISQAGIQNAITGLFSETRLDVGRYLEYSAGFARDFLWFLSAGPPAVTAPGGLIPLTPGTTYGPPLIWANEYQQAKQANTIIVSLSNVSSYTPAQIAAITGVVQTIKAVNFMMLAEMRDSVGIPLYAIVKNPTDPPYCNKDVWKYIVALLDSGFNQLNTAGPIPLPIQIPPGFASVGQTASPSTTMGSFAAFNRALAGKAGLELAYAIARNSAATHPTPTSPGVPDPTALQRADSALTASALYNPAAIAPPASGSFALDPYGVYHNFSGQSGDMPNGINAEYFGYNSLWDLALDVDTVNDLRWKNKLATDPSPVQLPQYAGASDGKNFVPYSSVSGPVPIVRNEELTLVRAQIQLGMGNLNNAITLINQVHQLAGGFATKLSIAPTYTAVRDSLMKEQRISTLFEGSGDRMIALRMYHLEAVADTTWQATSGPDGVVDAGLGHPTDYHTTVDPVPIQELSSRGGQWILQCP
jgi:hypothetical protein